MKGQEIAEDTNEVEADESVGLVLANQDQSTLGISDIVIYSIETDPLSK